jgi:metal-responsive CopG/Arc/MetJ family transcriptional regulator
MKTAISVPDDIFRSANALAKRMGVSRSKLIASALADFIAKHNERSITARLNAIYRTEDGRLDPALRRLQARSLARDRW